MDWLGGECSCPGFCLSCASSLSLSVSEAYNNNKILLRLLHTDLYHWTHIQFQSKSFYNQPAVNLACTHCLCHSTEVMSNWVSTTKSIILGFDESVILQMMFVKLTTHLGLLLGLIGRKVFDLPSFWGGHFLFNYRVCCTTKQRLQHVILML